MEVASSYTQMSRPSSFAGQNKFKCRIIKRAKSLAKQSKKPLPRQLLYIWELKVFDAWLMLL
jgi:hypothetical protein